LSDVAPARSHARERVSACLIVQDEQRELAGALESARFCDELVVVDGGSTDATVEIARAAGARVIENPWPGFAAQRNVALDAARGEWVFELDADERITPELRASIERLLARPPEGVTIAVCPLRHRFLGRPLSHSAKYPAYRSRLFRRGAYRHDEARGVHEGLEPRERPAVLTGELEHQLARTLDEALRDAWRYARLESGHLARPSNQGAYLNGIVLRPLAKVAYRTLVDQGWRDGWRGMLKILLDASSDALVWVLVLFGPARGSRKPEDTGPLGPPGSRKPEDTGPAAADDGDGGRHFGRRPAGAPKVVVLAGGRESSHRALAWLSGLKRAGIDVTLICDVDVGGDIPVRRVGRLRPVATMRALDTEMQLRTIHAVVAVGRRARLVRRLLAGTLRPALPGLDAEADPARVALSLSSDDDGADNVGA
jgi:hypothetical protein